LDQFDACFINAESFENLVGLPIIEDLTNFSENPDKTDDKVGIET